jgi:predicted dehydrogenase
LATIRAAVIGCGHFGRFHVEKWARQEGARLVAVCDRDLDNAQRHAEPHGAAATSDYRSLLGEVDAVSVVVPTIRHHEIASAFLEAGAHCLVEKPIAATVDEARALVALAQARGLVLQIGHLERFNPALLGLRDQIRDPLFIECDRLAPFSPRATDVSVVLDLMIHDLDVILELVPGAVTSVEAVGARVFSAEDDIVNARLRFARGCIANVTASRISLKTERKLRIFQPDAYVALDFHAKTGLVARKGEGEMMPGVPAIAIENRSFDPADQLALEIGGFVRAIRDGAPVPVPGEAGLRALELAMRIQAALERPPG